MRVLLIDDDASLGDLLREYFTGHRVTLQNEPDGERGLTALRQGGWDIVLLDVMLPGDDGFAICRKIRETSDVPVIMLTARGSDDDRVTGLEIGADDYVPKPFNPRELLARIRAIARRRGKPAQEVEEKLVFGPLSLDARSLTATFKNEPLALTSYEFRVLLALAERVGRPVSREELASAVSTSKGEDGYDPSVDRSLDVHVSRLRQKLEDDPAKPTWIRTVRGVGYVFLRPS
ncbi:MAG: response regulator transcription factor [Polyangiaceae bacterium]